MYGVDNDWLNTNGPTPTNSFVGWSDLVQLYFSPSQKKQNQQGERLQVYRAIEWFEQQMKWAVNAPLRRKTLINATGAMHVANCKIISENRSDSFMKPCNNWLMNLQQRVMLTCCFGHLKLWELDCLSFMVAWHRKTIDPCQRHSLEKS